MKNKRKAKLENREQAILQDIDGGDSKTAFAFNMVRLYYYIDDLINNKNHSKLINLIYVMRKDLTKWAQANKCNIGDRTAFRYRNAYVKLIEIIRNNEKVEEFIILLYDSIKFRRAG